MRTAVVLALLASFLSWGDACSVYPLPPHSVNATYAVEQLLYRCGASAAYCFRPAKELNATVAVRVERSADVEGWDYIRFTTDSAWFPDPARQDHFYAVGFAEGFLTANSIYSTWWNNVRPQFLLMPARQRVCVDEFIDAHFDFMESLDATTPFNTQVLGQLRWVQGVFDGYTAAFQTVNSTVQPPPQPLSFIDIFTISYMYEIGRVLDWCEWRYGSTDQSSPPRSGSRDHCSAIVKVTNDDVFFAHTSWFSYSMMVRQLKTYVGLGNATVTMSSYPGSLSSIDDWYVTSNGIAAAETTISAWTTNRDQFVTPKSVSEFLRVMAANFLARNAEEWVSFFATNNSGTYNNEYMVLDTRIAATRTAGAPLPVGSFYVAEQMPGAVVARDVTAVLNQNGYWASFNIPHFNETYNGLGYQAFYDMYGDYYSRTEYARAKLFARLHSSVVDWTSLLSVLRYNNYETDSESIIPFCDQWPGFTGALRFNCTEGASRSAALSLAARTDLAPLAGDLDIYSAMIGQVARGAWGAIDVKMTSVKQLADGKRSGIVVNGPTSTSLPAFSWSAFANASINNTILAYEAPHRQQPDVFDFEPVYFSEP